jgi:uncharacterized protein YndB with AHSA1/START domain
MKKILLGVLAVLVTAVAIVLGLATTKPDTFSVERQIVIAAPPAAIFANLDDFHRWGAWSPWEKMEPSVKKTFSGAPSGVGAGYAWEGKETGSGRMTITDSTPNQKLSIKLEFLKPFEATDVAAFDLTPTAAATRVRWSMSGPQNFMSKVMCVFMDMDKMIGKDFEAGLADLKRISESPAAAASAAAAK